MGTLNKAARKALWVTKGAALFGGAVVTLALVLGVGSVALAAVPGDPFKLGRVNQISAVTSLVGNLNDPMLRIDNNGTGTALDLHVRPDKQPLKVDSGQRVVNLNTDRLDSKDSAAFFSGKTYNKLGDRVDNPGEVRQVSATCDAGDAALSGGYVFLAVGPPVHVFREETVGDAYRMSFFGDISAIANVTCADFPPLRP